jgi:hypothetical protein
MEGTRHGCLSALSAANCLCSKLKIPQYQNGQAYLTSHRACYVDHDEPRAASVAINLKDVERPEFYVCLVMLLRPAT